MGCRPGSVAPLDWHSPCLGGYRVGAATQRCAPNWLVEICSVEPDEKKRSGFERVNTLAANRPVVVQLQRCWYAACRDNEQRLAVHQSSGLNRHIKTANDV